ncbi:hypothetical protein GCM10009865_05400 [Aeromicrobium ponti]|uniref:Uncharacterized protein n=1 Tax=Cytobacillus oceanisediminis TaxID=665099 RepID=A0A562K6F8_9BACI|nr:hypothetical protein [Cytobacillus oceanisediminis]TWH90997.1 hypothetical protein IQ19_00447 [Cytobacillus oceanisediminis]
MKKVATNIVSCTSNFIIYWALLVILPMLLYEIFMDVDEYIDKHHVDPAMPVMMIMGLGVGPIAAAWLSAVTVKRVNKLNRQKKFLILSVQSLLAISVIIFILNG